MNRVVRTELLKQRTTRTFVAGFAAAPVISALVSLVVLGAAGKQGNDPLGPDSLAHVLGAPAAVITLIALIVGLLGMAGEYRHETITTTFLASPRRHQVLLAKLAAHAVTGAAMAVASLTVSAAVALPWLHSSDVALRLDGDVLGVIVGLVASTALHGALGVSVGALIRNQAVAIAAVLVWLLAVEGIIGDLFARAAFVHWLPAAAGRALVHIGPHGDAPPVPAAAVLFAAYVAAFALAGTRFTLHRDIT